MTKGSIGTNALLNGIKEACTILSHFISFVYCSRILGSDGFGAYSFGQSVVSYFVLLAALGIPNYAIREGSSQREDKRRLERFVNEVFTISLITTIIAYFLLLVATLYIEKFYDYKWIIAILSIQIALNTLGTDWINSIYEDYLYLAVRCIIIQIISLVCIFVFVNTSNDLYKYAFITMLSNAGGNILNIFYLKKHGVSPKPVFRNNIKKHLLPIIILFCNSLAVVVYLNSDITMLGFYKSDNEVGLYSVSSKIYTLIKTLINAVIIVTVPRFSYYLGTNDYTRYKTELGNTFDTLIILIVPCVLGMFIESNKILLTVAGPGYIEGVNVVKVLSAALVFAVGACFFSYSILIPNRLEKRFLQSTIFAAITNISLNFLFIPWLGIIGAALTTLIAEIIVCIVSCIFGFKQARFAVDFKSLLTVLISGGLVLIVCLCTDYIINDWRFAFAIEIIVCAIVYFSVLYLLKNRIIRKVVHMIDGKLRGKA